MARTHGLIAPMAAIIMICCSGTFTPAAAQAGAIAGATITNEVVDNLFHRLDESMERAKQAGDYVTASALGKFKDALKAWQESSQELLDNAFSSLDRTSQDLLRSGSAIVDNALRETSVSLTTVERLVITADNLMENIPLGKGQSYILNYSPRVVGPLNDATVRITLVGVNLDRAMPVVSVGQTEIPSRIVGPTEVVVDIPVRLIPAAPGRLAQHDLTVKFSSASKRALLRMVGWRDDVERQITLFRVPANLATYTVTAGHKITRRGEQLYEARVGRFQGRNTEISQLAHPPTGWNWVMDHARRSEFRVVEYGGEKGSCHQAIGWNGSTESGIRISARVDEIRNLRTVGGSYRRKGGYVHCGLRGPIYSQTRADTTFLASGTIEWGKGVALNLPPSCERVEITVKMFNGGVAIHKGAAKNKYYTIDGSNCSFALNPELPTGF